MEKQKRVQKEWYEQKGAVGKEELIQVSLRTHTHRLKQLFPIEESRLCLNCGCGKGGQDGILGPSIGMDISFENVRALRRAGGVGVVADMESLPFRNQTFDIVYGFGILHHLSDIKKGLSEATRVLKKGGYIGFGSENNGWCPLNYVMPLLYRNWSIEKGFYRIRGRSLKKIFQQSGIREIKVSKGGMTIYGMGHLVYRLTSLGEAVLSKFRPIRAISGYCYIAGKKEK